MSANVVQFERIFRRSWDWSSHELAEFYRVESALLQAGLKIDLERGLSDEGDPWFAFCRPDDGEVIVHIARIGGLYILAGPAYDGVASGGDIAALVRDLVTRHPLIQMRGNTPGRSSNIFLHPAALLIAVVATAFFKSTEARALTDEHKSAAESRGSGGTARSDNISLLETHKTIVMEAVQSAVILSAIASVLQTPAIVPTPEPSAPVASTSDLLDLDALLPVAHHRAALEPQAVNFEAHQFELVPQAHAQSAGGTAVLAHAAFPDPGHAAVADMMPLVLVLWDLPNRTDTVPRDEGSPTAPNGVSAVTFQSPLVAFKMTLSNESHVDLPVVQAAKISFSGSLSVPETQTAAKPDQVPSALVGALKEAVHAPTDAQSVAAPNESFASALFQAVTDHTPTITEAKPLPALAPETPQSPSSSSTAPATTDAHATAPQPANKPLDVAAQMQSFFDHISNWKMVSDLKGVSVYDTDALKNHPTELTTVTFGFSDGSTLSLVGLPADLPHLLA